MKQHLWFIHGNLQQPTVWDTLSEHLEADYEIHKVNLWTAKQSTFWSWAEDFCNIVTNVGAQQNHHLIGYSLGGRLGLHALLHNPKLWQSAIIIAADTGLSNALTKEKQLAWDTGWAERFLSEDWQHLIDEWNKLSVFKGFENPNPPLEKDFSREAIAECFVKFSKGHQDDLLSALRALREVNISYITGRQDIKYSEKGKTLAQTCSAINHQIIADAGHRVPWENPEAFKVLLSELLLEHSN